MPIPAGYAPPVRFAIEGQTYWCRPRNVTAEGGCFEVLPPTIPESLKKGAVLDIQLSPHHEGQQARAKVVWVRKDSGATLFGVKYSEPASAFEITQLDMDRVRIDPMWALLVPESLAKRRLVLPFALVKESVQVACADTGDDAAIKAVERYVRRAVHAIRADRDSLRRAIERVYGGKDVATEGEEPQGAAAVCDELLTAAALREASDIHVNPEENEIRILFRVEGQLEEFRRIPKDGFAELFSRFKVMSGMDIAEKRVPQDGRFTHRLVSTGRTIDVRSATLPTKYGESMTLRLLALKTESLTLDRLGMSAKGLEHVNAFLKRPYGLMLITGPTGSGKSTTLYAALRRLMEFRKLNIITIEDPIEYDISGVTQVELHEGDKKVDFSKALRSSLRHDPDVIMIGEIRDRETVDVAIKAALTGHLVLSTLHTNTAASAVTRLIDMGVDRYLVAATLRLAIAQRLVRRLCVNCRVSRPMTEAESGALRRPAATTFEPGTCIYCAGKGYAGRIGLFELMTVDEEISRSIARGIEESELAEMMRRREMTLLVEDAASKVVEGATTVQDVLAAVALW
jgi:type IV pilus assembly protein PilB